MNQWNHNRITAKLGIKYPLIQGRLGGLSSQRLTAAVSNFGGLGSFGARSLPPAAMKDVTAEIWPHTCEPIAMKSWVSMSDEGSRGAHEIALMRRLPPLSVHV